VISTPLERLTTGPGGDQDAALSPDGNLVAYSSTAQRTRIWSFALDAAGRIAGSGLPVTLGGSGEYDAAVSANGEQLIYRTIRDGRQEVWERSLLDGHERRLITGDEAVRSSPRWSPDGSRIAYQLSPRRSESGSLLAVFALSDMREQVLTRPGAESLVPDDWSRDGSLILGPCAVQRASTSGACVAPAATPATVRPIVVDPDRNLRSLRFSPDQRWISAVAFPRERNDGADSIVVMPSNGGSMQPLTDGTHYDQKPVWSSDSATVYFVSNRDGFFNVWGRHFDGAAGRPVGDVFQVTSLASPRQMIAPDLERAEIAIAAHHLYVPVTETAGQVFILENLSR
jgi:Tol biopolymer transport system component